MTNVTPVILTKRELELVQIIENTWSCCGSAGMQKTLDHDLIRVIGRPAYGEERALREGCTTEELSQQLISDWNERIRRAKTEPPRSLGPNEEL